MNEIKFSDLGLSETLLRSITDLGFEKPSQIQAEAIPVAIEGFDLIGQAQTGTGKTAAFGCGIINNITDKSVLNAVILAPTRELAIQVCEELKRISKHDRLNILPIYGGDPMQHQIRELKRNVNIVVGTPGRVLDHIKRGTLVLDTVKFLVLDEADEMLNMGFIDDLEDIIGRIPEDRQTLLFSATMPAQIKRLAARYMKPDAKHIAIKKNSLTVSKITQNFFEVTPKTRFEALCRILDLDNPNAAIIFCKTKRGVDEVVSGMQSRGYVVEGMHGDMSQAHRMRTLKKFKEGGLSFLVATDVAARGIDVEGVTHVINYDLPQDVESYVHRIGRTGRANKEGTAYTLITHREQSMLKQIKNVTKAEITRKAVPTVEEIFATKSSSMVDEVRQIIEKNDFEKFVAVATELNEKFNSVDIIAALIKSQFKTDMSATYSDNTLEAPKGEDIRLFISVGRRDGLTPKGLVSFIQETANVKPSSVGDIDILENFAFVNVTPDIQSKVMDTCIGQRLNKRKVNIEVANKKRR